MKSTKTITTMVFVVVLVFGLLQPQQTANAASEAIYDAIPNPLPGNITSLGFEATSTSEAGDYIHLSAGTHRDTTSVTVTMSTWALHSTYPSMDSSGWQHPITLNIYNVTPGTPNLRSSLIASHTQIFDIPWRPEGDASCGSTGYGLRWRAPDGNCYNGMAFNITFDLSSLGVTLPDDVILAIAFNTQHYGAFPIGVSGPYNSLNLGLQGSIKAGTDDNTDNIFLDSKWSGAYGSNWNGGVGGLREDSSWGGYGTMPFQILWKDGIFPTAPVSIPANGSTQTSGPTQLSVSFSEDVLHDGSSAAADFTGNYLLFEAGSNGSFDTTDCVSGIASDDVAISVDGIVYSAATFTATLNINAGIQLPAGRYRLLACGTTSIEDVDGYKLNSGLMDSTFTFSVTAPRRETPTATIPATGFAPDRFTTLPAQTVSYSTQDDLWVEVPTLGIRAAIVGVPQSNGSWDVTWLGNQAGWLDGSAFPTWVGNSVLTGHVWNADNTPGIFYGIDTLSFGDEVIVHYGNTQYVYAVQQVKQVSSNDIKALLKHEERSWITLVTCKGYNEASGTYLYRTLVRAVLVSVK